jgi:hypothetical protein
MVARRKSMEISVRHEEHDGLYCFGPLESKILRPVWWWNYLRVIFPKEEAVDVVPLRGAPSRLILAHDLGLQVSFHLSLSVTTWKAYPNSLKLSKLC